MIFNQPQVFMQLFPQQFGSMNPYVMALQHPQPFYMLNYSLSEYDYNARNDTPPITQADKGPRKKNYHSLSIFNIPYNMPYEEINRICNKYGELFEFQIIPNKGIALLTYYDLRCTSKAYQNLLNLIWPIN